MKQGCFIAHSDYYVKKTSIIVAITFFCLLITYSVHAAFSSPQERSPDLSKIPEIHVLIDMSAPMKKNDSLNLRIQMVKLFAYLMQQQAQMSVLTFTKSTKVLVPVALVDGTFQTSLSKGLDNYLSAQPKSLSHEQHPGSAEPKLPSAAMTASYSNIDNALNQADKSWISDSKIIILLSNGVEQERSLFQSLDSSTILKLQQGGVRVFTIGFSDAADQQFLNNLALKTNALSQVVRNSNDLDTIAYSIFTAAIPVNGIPIRAYNDTTRSVKIDNNVYYLIFLFKKRGDSSTLFLTDPKGIKKNVVQLTSPNGVSGAYSLVGIDKPTSGTWILSGPDQEIERAIIRTDISLSPPILSGVYFENELVPVESYIEHDGKPLTLPLLYKYMTISLKFKNEWSSYFYKIPYRNNGLYTAKIRVVAAKGRYSSTLIAQNSFLSREVSSVIDVYPEPLKNAAISNLSSIIELTHPEYINAETAAFKAILDDDLVDVSVVRDDNSWIVDLSSLCPMLLTTKKAFIRIKAQAITTRVVTFKFPLPTNLCPPPVLESQIPVIPKKSIKNASDKMKYLEAQHRFNLLIYIGSFFLILLLVLFIFILISYIKSTIKLDKSKEQLKKAIDQDLLK